MGRALGCGGSSAIWGGATFGLLVGAVVGLVTGDIGSGARNGVIAGAVVGIIAELLGALGDWLKRRQTPR